MVWHPSRYAELLADKIRKHDAKVWLVNTGWSGGPYGVGKRFKLSYTRAIIDAIHDGSLAQAEYLTDSIFGVSIPQTCSGVPSDMLNPRSTWTSPEGYDKAANGLATLFQENFKKFEDGASEAIRAAGPVANAAV